MSIASLIKRNAILHLNIHNVHMMSIRTILKKRFFCFFRRTVYYKGNLLLLRKFPELEGTRALPNVLKYFSFAFLNLIYFAETESLHKHHHNNDSGALTIDSAINKSDEFFSVGKFEDSANVLKAFEDSENVEVLWRISRALYNMSKQKGIKNSEIALLITEAYNYVDKALKLDENNFAVHKWMAILYDAKSSLEGIKARIKALPVFKQHLMRAIELNPKDATSIYMLGQYMYNIADMSWLQKTIAKTLFGTPPEATFEEAFYYFSKAEDVEPNFYSANLLMLGKTCLKLKRIEAGCYWLKCAISYPVRTDEDEAVRLEAEELLQKYPGVKQPSKEEITTQST